MKQKTMCLPVLACTAGFSILGFLLYFWQRSAQGVPLAGSDPRVVIPFAVSGIFLILTALLCSRVRRDADYDFAPGLGSCAGYLIGGTLLIVVHAMAVAQHQTLWLNMLGCVCGVIVLWHAAARLRGRVPELLSGCLIVVFLIAQIISNFKDWSTDPMLIDYCFKLMALLCSMLALFHTAGFSAARGKRRLGAFWCACSVYFCVMCLPADGLDDLTQLLDFVALAALSAQNLVCMLRARPDAPAGAAPAPAEEPAEQTEE